MDATAFIFPDVAVENLMNLIDIKLKDEMEIDISEGTISDRVLALKA